jgi:hypothetical protein
MLYENRFITISFGKVATKQKRPPTEYGAAFIENFGYLPIGYVSTGGGFDNCLCVMLTFPHLRLM